MRGKSFNKNTQPCWTCSNLLDCPWGQFRQPRDDWKAERHPYYGGGYAYSIKECPGYKDDRPLMLPYAEYTHSCVKVMVNGKVRIRYRPNTLYYCPVCDEEIKKGVDTCPMCDRCHLDWSDADGDE